MRTAPARWRYIPSPPISSFHIGPLDVHFYALGYIIGITLAILITRRRWRALGGDPDLVNDLALWVVPAGIIGGRIYFDITTPDDIPHVWYGVFAVWTGGLGIWGGVALAAAVGAWRLHRLGITVGPFANAIAPALLVAQAVGRIGNYFNKELFGKPTTLPWGLEIPYQYRVSGGIPAQDLHFATFQPSFLYELIWDLALAAFLVWLGHHARIKPWGLFALYVAGYSGLPDLRGDDQDRLLRVLPRPAAEHVRRDRPDGHRAGLVRAAPSCGRSGPYTVLPPGAPEAAGAVEARPDEIRRRGTAGEHSRPGEHGGQESTAGETAAVSRLRPARASWTSRVAPAPVRNARKFPPRLSGRPGRRSRRTRSRRGDLDLQPAAAGAAEQRAQRQGRGVDHDRAAARRCPTGEMPPAT